ncbi:uncharacterized protein A1O9_04738 [Exophiala aquamarina CBS 119918]|uniref:TauD/TfdA-like domain-containing protein n=1 Tax=Exophiala aquamarina CBS 119918 TaxID=1182545 RepID=A0A072PWD5_9EURO|nr:uncharacterized protein A1O9_04738 [Exophiala aquamarina CBS 119918]KEF59890.1 hypothetical protein A1O9_04738 [Exophiala aquamarina CBS 119918]
MSPPGILVDAVRRDYPADNEFDFDDLPAGKVKISLRQQYKDLDRPAVVPGAKIDWVPSRAEYLERIARRLKQGIPHATIPDKFPKFVSSAACWSFDSLNISKNEICPGTFPLPSLKPLLDSVAEEVHLGQGIGILRGLDPSKYSFEDNILIYAGIASYVGSTRGTQDKDGNVLVHIRNVGADVAPDDQRQSPYANNAQPFHNDLGDIIALYCIDRALTGGTSRVASTSKVYNELAGARPDLIQEMVKGDWVFDKHDDTGAYYKRPILFHDVESRRVFFCFSRRQLTGSVVSPRPAHFPPLREAQAEALDAVHFTAEKHALDIQLEKGDIQFLNNLALFHAREAFQDGDDSRQRHLVRMWLRNEDLAWKTPDELQLPWEHIYGRAREPVWHMSPNHGRAHVINGRESCHG